MKLVLLLWFLLCSGVSHNCALANPISREQALQNARDFFAAKGKTLPERSFRHAPVKNGVLTVEANYFVFNVGDDQGFVIAAGDDCVPAILGYADRGTFAGDSLPANVKWWLDGYSDAIGRLQAS